MQDHSPGDLLDGHRERLHTRYIRSNWPAETFFFKKTSTEFRYSTWVFSRDYAPSDCHGRPKREICNFGVLDLPMLRSLRSHLFLNKFDLAVDALAVGCWAELVASGRGD